LSEYKRQIAAGATVAVVVVFVLTLGLGAFLPGAATSQSLTTTATSGTLTASSTSPTFSASSSSSAPSSGTSSSTATVSATSSTVSLTSTTTPVTTITSATTTATISSTTTGVTSVCYTCGILQIESVNLTVGAAGNRTILSLTIANDGYGNISDLSVSLASTPVLVIPALSAGTQTWVSIQVPDSQPVAAGQSYQVVIQGGYGSYAVGANMTVEASSA